MITLIVCLALTIPLAYVVVRIWRKYTKIDALAAAAILCATAFYDEWKRVSVSTWDHENFKYQADTERYYRRINGELTTWLVEKKLNKLLEKRYQANLATNRKIKNQKLLDDTIKKTQIKLMES